jgi:hypothetical protein
VGALLTRNCDGVRLTLSGRTNLYDGNYCHAAHLHGVGGSDLGHVAAGPAVGTVLIAAYILVSVASLLLIVASNYGWFGVQQDPLSAVFALLIALPWSLMLLLLDDSGPLASGLLLCTGMVINATIMMHLLSRTGRKRQK